MDATRPWPFYDGEAERIYLGQVIEHLDYPRGVRRCLEEAARVLSPAGQCLVVCPDFAAHIEKRVPAEVVEAERAGMRRWPGDEHRWCPERFTVRAELCRVFEMVRAVNVLNLGGEWPAGTRNPWDCASVCWGRVPPAVD